MSCYLNKRAATPKVAFRRVRSFEVPAIAIQDRVSVGGPVTAISGARSHGFPTLEFPEDCLGGKLAAALLRGLICFRANSPRTGLRSRFHFGFLAWTLGHGSRLSWGLVKS